MGFRVNIFGTEIFKDYMRYWQGDLFDGGVEGNDYEAICQSISNEKTPYLKPDDFGKAIHEWSKSNIKKPIKTLCLFSGAGGLDIGFHDVGFDIVECVELESQFVKSLEKNKEEGKYFSNTNIICDDIRNYIPSKSLKVDFIIGGPPCQTFSKAGIRAAGAKGRNDSRGTLFEEYVRVLDQLKPKGFLFENVTGILSAEKGEAMKSIVTAFEDVGYNLSFRILDTSDYGVPQNRERLILVGTRNKSFEFPAPTHGIDSKRKIDYYSAGEALKGVKNKDDAKPGLNGRFGHLLDEIPPGLNYSYYTERMGHPKPVFAWRSKFSDFLYKADPELPVRTLKASGGQYTGPFHWLNRHFTVDELKRLQTFPDDYHIVGGRGVGAKQIGNSVPPHFARILGLSILDQIFNVKLPFELNKVDSSQTLHFRKLKTLRTKYYSEKAKKSIANLEHDHAPTKISSRDYYGCVLENTKLDESLKSKKGYQKVKFEALENRWEIKIGDKDKIKVPFKIIVSHKEDTPLFNNVNSVLITGDANNLDSYFTGWKAFEREVIQNGIKADLVQLNGYYQYKPILKMNYEVNLDEVSSKLKDFWFVLQTMIDDVDANEIRNIHSLSEIYDLSSAKLVKAFKQLKNVGFEIRNHNTNSEIPENHYLVPYQFPSLNAQSLQRLKDL